MSDGGTQPREEYLATCWNCLGEFDAGGAVWCSCDPKNPTKLCPFCFCCFCDASETYKKEFWRGAPERLQEELQTLNRSHDRLGDILIRMGKITTPQLLEALVDQRDSKRRLGEVLVERGLVSPEDVAAALRTQGTSALTDTSGADYSARPVWEKSDPATIIQYVLKLAAKKSASDVHLEPSDEAVGVKLRIDGFSFRLDPLPKRIQDDVADKFFEIFQLDPARSQEPQTSRIAARLSEQDYDLVAQTLPTSHGLNLTVKLINRATFLKDLTSLGLETDDRVHLLEKLSFGAGLILLSSPVYNGAHTTRYSLLNLLAGAQREIVSLESPIQWIIDGARQVEVRDLREMESMLRSAIAVRPEVIFLSALPDAPTAQLAAQLATSLLVIAVVPAASAVQAVGAVVGLGVPRQIVAEAVEAVLCQRLVRLVCPICRAPAPSPAAQTLAHLGLSREATEGLKVFRGRGCPKCNKVGYRGRRAVFELINAGQEVKAALLAGHSLDEIQTAAVRTGMTPLRRRCLRLVREGVTSFDEFSRLRL